MTEAGARPRVGFVGAGRVGKGLALALSRRGYSITGLAGRAGNPSAQSIVGASALVFLTVPDDAIAAAAAQLTWR